MQSGLERYVWEKLRSARRQTASRDRGVLLAALLAFVPVFPACTIGMLIASLNLYLIKKQRLPQREARLTLISILTGALWTSLWIIFGISLATTLADVLQNIGSYFLHKIDNSIDALDTGSMV